MKANKNQQQGLTEINLTSLVDVALTLVIIFMVSSPFIMQSGIRVSSPSVEKAESAEEVSDIKAEVFLKSDGSLVLNGRRLTDHAFPDSLRSLLATSTTKQVVIRASKNVLHDEVIALLDQAKQVGAQSLSIVKSY
ncbi:biopolymer transporter ExbD [bacterium]|nr:biopolymer transporter ExbD [bacterium]